MRIAIKKGSFSSTVNFNYNEKFHTITANFNSRTYYLNTKDSVSKRDATRVVSSLVGRLKKKGYRVNTNFSTSMFPLPYPYFIRVDSASGRNVSLVTDIENYRKILSFSGGYNVIHWQ